MRRTLMLCALLALGLPVSGWARGEGHAVVEVEIDFPPVDSLRTIVANGLAVSQINDSLWFASKSFSYDGPWTNLVCRFVALTKDTATATGLCRDSAIIKLQTKVDSDTVAFWKTVGATNKWPLASWDSTGTAAGRAANLGQGGSGVGYITDTAVAVAAVGMGGVYRGIPTASINYIDADSVAVTDELFRFLVLYAAEEDSLESHCILRSSSYIDILTKLNALCTFHLR